MDLSGLDCGPGTIAVRPATAGIAQTPGALGGSRVPGSGFRAGGADGGQGGESWDRSSVVSQRVVLGPGTVRVGRFIGRLGVVSLPAVGAGLDLDQRVVRRHVAKLEAAGWLAREPWIWGEGSVLWLTGAGVEGAGLGGVRPVKSPPGATTIAHGVLVGWSAARIERRGRVWKAARELAVESDWWVVRLRCERGYTEPPCDTTAQASPSPTGSPAWRKRSGSPVRSSQRSCRRPQRRSPPSHPPPTTTRAPTSPGLSRRPRLRLRTRL
jgi:hypothetical protein